MSLPALFLGLRSASYNTGNTSPGVLSPPLPPATGIFGIRDLGLLSLLSMDVATIIGVTDIIILPYYCPHPRAHGNALKVPRPMPVSVLQMCGGEDRARGALRKGWRGEGRLDGLMNPLPNACRKSIVRHYGDKQPQQP